MTKRRAVRLTGYEIRELASERGLLAMGAFEGDTIVAKGVGRADFLALRTLVHRVYMLHSRKAMEQYDWLCARMPFSQAARDPSSQAPVAQWNT